MNMKTTTTRRPTAEPMAPMVQQDRDPAFQGAMKSLQQLQIALAKDGIRTQEDFVARYGKGSELGSLLSYQSAHQTVAKHAAGLAVGKWLDAAIAKGTSDGLSVGIGGQAADAASVLEALDTGLTSSQDAGLPKHVGGLDQHIGNMATIVKEELDRVDSAIQTVDTESVPALESRWSEYVAKNRSGLGGVDINALVQAVLRESYMETTKDLQFYAEKVKFFNEVKKEIRSELTRAREFLAGVAGMDGTALLENLFFGKDFNTDFLVPGSPIFLEGITEALKVTTPSGEELVLSPELLENPGLWAAVYALEMKGWDPDPKDYAKACSGDDCGDIIESLYYFMAVDTLIQGHQDDYKPEDLVKDLKDQYGIDARQEGSGSGVEIVMPNGTKFKDCSGNGGMGEADFDFDKALGVVSATMGFTEAGYDMEGGFKDMISAEFVQTMQAMMADTGSQYPKDQMLDMAMLAFMMGEAGIGGDESGSGKPVATKADLETYIQSTEETLQSVGDDAQLANVDLQNMLQKQQQTMQMMSNIAKMLHDTSMAIIRKIGG